MTTPAGPGVTGPPRHGRPARHSRDDPPTGQPTGPGQPGDHPTGDGWSVPTFYAGSQLVEPRLFTEADPLGAPLVADWSGEAPAWARLPGADGGSDHARVVWGETTYVGRRRARRRAEQAAMAAFVDLAPGPPPPGVAAGADADLAVESLPTPTPVAQPDSDRRLLSASRSMAVASLASRVTGFARSVLLIAALGSVGGVSNAYNSGNNLPNMVYELLLGGVLSSVLIPLLVKAQADDTDGGVAYTQRLLSIATLALGIMTILATAAAPWIASAFVHAGPQRELTTLFATMLLPEIFFYGLGAMFMAVLNINHVYRPGAWAPLLNNVIVIATITVFWTLPGPMTLNPSTITTTQVLVLGIGTTLGIAAQAVVLLPALRRIGFRWQWRLRARPHEIGRLREVAALTGWVFGYVVASQIGVSVIQWAGIRNGGFTVFSTVDLLFQMPYGILVVSLLTAIMPRLSRAAVRGDTPAVVGDLSLGARLSAVALLPVTGLLIALGPAVGVTLFAFGRSTVDDAHLLGSALALSAFGLFPFAVVMLQLRVFYAMRDGRTPTIINAAMVAVKVVLVLVTTAAFRAPAGTRVDLHPAAAAVEWLNIATSLSYVVGAVVGHVLLSRRLGRLGWRAVARTVLQLCVVAALGGGVAFGLAQLFDHVLTSARAGAVTGLVVGGTVGLAAMVVAARAMRIPDVLRLTGGLTAGRRAA